MAQVNRCSNKELPEALAWYFGVLAPALALLVGSIFWLSADIGLDPLPTPMYTSMVASVPMIYACLLLLYHNRNAQHPSIMPALLAIAMSTSLFYTLLFLSLFPYLLLLSVVSAGLTLLPIAPLGALLTGLGLYQYVIDQNSEVRANTRVFWVWFICSFLLLCSEDFNSIVVRTGIHWANADESNTSSYGVKLLRHFGNRRHLLHQANVHDLSYPPNGGLLTQWLVSNRLDHSNKARRAFYLATGIPYYLADPPITKSYYPKHFRYELGFDRGGAYSGPRLAGLSLNKSKIEAWLDSDSALAKFSWTLEIINTADVVASARLTLQMPSGAVPYLATLWLNDKEREATIIEKHEASSLYFHKDVRNSKRLMVESRAGERLKIHAGNIASGDSMQFKIAYSVPLRMLDSQSGYFVLPSLTGRNF